MAFLPEEADRLPGGSGELRALNERWERTLNEVREKLEENEKHVDEMRSALYKMAPKVHETAEEMYRSIVGPEMEHLRVVNEYYLENADFTWIVDKDLAQFLHGSKRKLYSEVFPLTGYPFRAQARLKLHHNGEVSFGLAFKDPEALRRKLRVRPIPSVFATLHDQTQQGAQPGAHLVSNGRYSHVRPLLKYDAFDNFYFRRLPLTTLRSAPYNRDHTLSIAIHVERPEVARSVYSYDGTLTWAIDHFRGRRDLEAKGCTESYLSPYMYTSENGYRVRVQVRLSGRGEEHVGLSVHVSFLNGLNDNNFSLSLLHSLALLFRSFYHKTTVTLFHPTRHYLSLSKSAENGFRDYWIDIGSHAQVDNLLYNDTLYYRVTIEEITPPTSTSR